MPSRTLALRAPRAGQARQGSGVRRHRGAERESGSQCLQEPLPFAHQEQVKLCKGCDHGDIEAQNKKTLAFIAFRDPCLRAPRAGQARQALHRPRCDEILMTLRGCQETEKDPNGGSFPAYPSGKSWNAASGKTGSGRKFFHSIIPGSALKTEPFYVAIITPAIHYCTGGLEID